MSAFLDVLTELLVLDADEVLRPRRGGWWERLPQPTVQGFPIRRELLYLTLHTRNIHTVRKCLHLYVSYGILCAAISSFFLFKLYSYDSRDLFLRQQLLPSLELYRMSQQLLQVLLPVPHGGLQSLQWIRSHFTTQTSSEGRRAGPGPVLRLLPAPDRGSGLGS